MAVLAKATQDQSSYLEVMVQSIQQAYCEPIVEFAKEKVERAQKAVHAAEQARSDAQTAVWSFLATG